MKKILFLLMLAYAICGSSEATSDVGNSGGSAYGAIRFMGGVPMVGVGMRTKAGMYAFDFSGNTCCLYPPHSLKLFHFRSLCLVYPR